MSNQKYSDWLKVDLHIHTDLSKKTKDSDYKGTFTVPILKQKLKENDVEIFSLTDHNIFNVDAYQEYYTSYDPVEDPLLLPGVELDLKVEHNGNIKTYHTLLIFRKANDEKIKEISLKLEAKYTELNITNSFERKLTIDQVVNLFNKEEFFFIPHAHRHKTGIVKAHEGHLQDAQEMILLMPSALEKVKAEAIIKYNEGFDLFLSEGFKSKEDMAYINFSDNHNIEKYPCIHKGDKGDHDFFYLKGTKNYETLRLAFIDPKSRIMSPDDFNSINHSLNTVEKIEITGDSFLGDNTLTFSPNLYVIIGGRSSGKSLLHNLLGHKIDRINVGNKYGEKVKHDNITIKSGRDAALQGMTSLSDDIIYLNQGDIVRYFEEKKLDELADESNKKTEYLSAQAKFKEYKRSLQEKKDNLIGCYKIAYSTIRKNYVLHSGTVNRLLDENYIFKFDKVELLKRNDINQKLDDAEELIITLEENLKKFKENPFFSFNEDDLLILENFASLVENKKVLLVAQKLTKQNITSFIEEVAELVDTQNQSFSLEAKAKDEANSEITQLLVDVKNNFEKLVKLKAKCDALENFEYSLNEKIVLNENVSLVLEVEKRESLKSLIVDGLNNSIDEASLYQNVLNLIKNLSTSIKSFPGKKDGDTLDKKITKQLSDLFQIMDSPTDYLEYTDGGTSKENSPGYNSEKYLEIILKNPNNKLIFIDQPEDNLGNKFIAEKLVKLIRELKFQKQFFLVTHNPSIVVYGDAENVIIASNENNRISYKQIVLENQDYQKEICDILDGGEYIFDNRSKKYNIKRILQKERNNA